MAHQQFGGAWCSVLKGTSTCDGLFEAMRDYSVFRRIFGKSTKWFCDSRAFMGITGINMGIWSLRMDDTTLI
jgi:hypothetical protein